MNGIILLCRNKPHYAAAAFNLAASIKYHNKDLHITLLSDGIHRSVFNGFHYGVFNLVKEISETDIAESKLSISKYSFADKNLYLDVDSICLKDLSPLFYALKGNDFKSNVVDNYTQWTSEESFRKHFDTDFGQTINSSWIYFEKKKVFNEAQKLYSRGFPINELTDKWGGVLPDELFFNASLSRLGVDASTDTDVMYFDDKRLEISDIEKKYYFITYYGKPTNSRVYLQEYYDRYMFKILNSMGLDHKFKIHDFLKNKLINNK